MAPAHRKLARQISALCLAFCLAAETTAASQRIHCQVDNIRVALGLSPAAAIDFKGVGIQVAEDSSSIRFYDPSTGEARLLAKEGLSSFISVQTAHPSSFKIARWPARVQGIYVDANEKLHVQIELPFKDATGHHAVRELTQEELITARTSEQSRQLFQRILPQAPVPIPGVRSIEQSWRGTRITTNEGIFGDIDEEHRHISAALQGSDGVPIALRIRKISVENGELKVEVEFAVSDNSISFVRDAQNNVRKISVSPPRSPGHLPSLQLLPNEIATGRMSQSSRDLFRVTEKVRTGEIPAFDNPLIEGKPAGEVRLDLLKRLVGNPQEAGQINERARAELAQLGVRVDQQIDSMGRRVRSAVLESSSQRARLEQGLHPKEVLEIYHQVGAIDVYQVRSVAASGAIHPSTPALQHPLMPKFLELMQKMGARLDIDPALELVNSGGQFSPTSKSIVIGPRSTWQTFRHEFQHLLFNDLRIGDFYSRLLTFGREGRLSEALQSPSIRSELHRLRSQGISDESLNELAKCAFDQIPVQAANETLAVQAELDELRGVGLGPSTPAYKRARVYAVEWQVHLLSKLKSQGEASETQLKALQAAQKEWEALK